jgi:hypothetical protein
MSGWPSRIFKSMLGATLRDARPVENPEIEWAARYIELLKHTAVGAALIAPRATLCAEWNTGTSSFTIHHQAEAWNVNNALAHPTLDRTSTGSYTYTFAATYPDMDGALVAFDPRGYRVDICKQLPSSDVLPYHPAVYRAGDIELPALYVRLRDAGDTSVDVPFWLEVL